MLRLQCRNKRLGMLKAFPGGGSDALFMVEPSGQRISGGGRFGERRFALAQLLGAALENALRGLMGILCALQFFAKRLDLRVLFSDGCDRRIALIAGCTVRLLLLDNSPLQRLARLRPACLSLPAGEIPDRKVI